MGVSTLRYNLDQAVSCWVVVAIENTLVIDSKEDAIVGRSPAINCFHRHQIGSSELREINMRCVNISLQPRTVAGIVHS